MKRLKVVQHSTFVYLVACNRSLIFKQFTNAVDEGSQVYVYNNGPQEEDGSKGQVGKYMCNTLLLQKCACAWLQVCWVLKIEKGVVPKYNGLVDLAGVMAFCIS